MKTIKIFLAAALISVFCGFTLAEDPVPYFNTSYISVPVGYPQGTAAGSVYFDLAEIDNSLLTVSSGANAWRTLQQDYWRLGTWTHNNGNGSFSGLTTYYTDQPGYSNIRNVKGFVFVDVLGDSKKDVVMLKDNTLQVHQNQSNTISGVVQDITSGAGSYMDAGSFNYQDNYPDVVVTDGYHIKIFRNNKPNGLDPNFWGPFNITSPKVKIRQIDDKAYESGYYQIDPNNRADLIVYNGSTLQVYLNNNNNGINGTPFASFDVGFPINDIEVADFTDDGYNDIVAVGGASLNFTAKVFKNGNGYGILQDPIYTLVSSTYLYYSPLVTASDVNRDGLNDLIFVSLQGNTSLFINKRLTSPTFFEQTPDQNFLVGGFAEQINQIKTADIYNGGGIALFYSCTGTASAYYGVKAVNALNSDPPPVPPILQGELFQDGPVYRPWIRLNKRGERDFLRYDIYKLSPSTGGLEILIAQTTADNFIDYSEYVTISGEDSHVYNCYYYAKMVDQTSHVSANSKLAYYTVGGIPTCPDCGGDNLGNVTNVQKPTEYAITNFPNPFNPFTTICYALPKFSHVKITVYNAIGELVKELVNEDKNTGTYAVMFDGSKLASGLYIYRIETGDFISTKKMVLVK
jgi:hypothetical protein